MNNVTMRSAYSKIKASDEFKNRLTVLLQGDKPKGFSRRIRPLIAAAACLTVAIGVVFVYPILIKPAVQPSPGVAKAENGIAIPEIKPPKNNASTADMIGLIVYKGQIYTQAYWITDSENAEKLKDKKLGEAKGNIDEWSKRKDYSSEFASNVIGDVYSVKGYDPRFRIMCFLSNGTKCLYECLSSITVSSGRDVFSKLKLRNNVTRLTYIDIEHYDYVTPICNIEDKGIINSFVDNLYDSKPVSLNKVPGLDWNNSADTRYIELALKDGCKASLALIKGGYVHYAHCDVAFKMDDHVFNTLWEKLDKIGDSSAK